MSLRNLFFLAFIFLLAACSKEDLATTVVNDETTLMALVMGDDRGKEGYKGNEKSGEDCFELVYPVTVIMPDDSSITGMDEDDLWGAIKDWYDANPNSDQRPSLVFPVDVVFNDGTIQTIEDNDAMKALWEDCDGEKKTCYEFVLPLSVTMPDGTTIAVNEEEDWGQIRLWYEAHPDVETKFSFNFPVEVIFKDEETKVIENEEDLEDLEKDCYGDKRPCYKFVLPISMTLPDGTAVTINEEEDWDIVKDWYEANPDVEQRPTIDFPVGVNFGDDEIVTVSSSDELADLAKDCYDDYEKDCFELELPVSWTMPDATTITVTSEDEWSLIRDWYDAHPDVEADPVLQYPVEVILEDGTTQTVDDEAAMDVLKDDCEE